MSGVQEISTLPLANCYPGIEADRHNVKQCNLHKRIFPPYSFRVDSPLDQAKLCHFKILCTLSASSFCTCVTEAQQWTWVPGVAATEWLMTATGMIVQLWRQWFFYGITPHPHISASDDCLGHATVVMLCVMLMMWVQTVHLSILLCSFLMLRCYSTVKWGLCNL